MIIYGEELHGAISSGQACKYNGRQQGNKVSNYLYRVSFTMADYYYLK